MTNQANCRADVSTVVAVTSKAYARTLPREADEPWTEIRPGDEKRMSNQMAILQEVEWETERGLFGASTLKKRVDHSTMCCPDCKVPGYYDRHGMIVCPNECGRIISDTPLLVPEDSFNDRTGGPTSGSAHNVFFNDGSGKQALNPAAFTPEPDVQ